MRLVGGHGPSTVQGHVAELCLADGGAAAARRPVLIYGAGGGFQVSAAVAVVAMFVALLFSAGDEVFMPPLAIGVVVVAALGGRLLGRSADEVVPPTGTRRARSWTVLGTVIGLVIAAVGVAGPVLLSWIGYRQAASVLLVTGYFGLPALAGGMTGAVVNARYRTHEPPAADAQ